MESLESIIWVLAVFGVLAVNLYRQWKQHRDMRGPARGPAAPAPSPAQDVVAVPTGAAGSAQQGRFDESEWGWAPPREPERPPAYEPAPQPLAARQAPVRAPSWHDRGAHARATAYTPAAPAPQRLSAGGVGTQGRRRGPLFNPHTDLRAAVIGMTVLGPCRANAPYDPHR